LGRNTPETAFGEAYYELYYHRYEEPSTTRPEPVVLAAVLADTVNANLKIRSRVLVDKINGIRIEKLEDVVRAVDNCTNSSDIIEFLPHQSFECLDRGAVTEANSRILKTYGIATDRRL
jgi:hypothetical protein